MASTFFFPCSILHYKNHVATTRRFDVCKPLCSSSQSKSMAVTEDNSLNRRSANYAPPLWSFDHVQSLSSKYTGEDYEARVDSLKKSVKTMIQEVVGNPLKTLELVDNLQRLGISYHFEEEISQVLEMIYNDYYKTQEQWNGMDMNLKALGFRLLRQHGHHVPQEMFLNFKVKAENDKPQSDEDNNHVVGMLNLYEASYHSFEDESILDDARDFTTKYLKESVDRIDGSSSLGSLINHALELPLHWRIARLEAKWFIEAYREIVSPTLMELAILDFNMVQAINLQDLKESSRWWRNTCWDKKLSFSRDRLVEGYMWTIGVWSLPNFSLGRRTLTKVNAIITAFDDIYDIYGTLDELQQFTDVITRWDINAVEELPDYMKICFLGSFNVINEMAYNTLANSNSGVFILPYLKKAWEDLCNAYLLEAQWYQSGYIPTLEEYLHNASVSISVPVGLMHCNFLTSNYTSTQEIQQCIERSANIVHYSALILRLADDLGTSSDEMARGDNPKSIQCYMHESGATEDEARNYMKSLINKTWKKLTKERAGAAATCEFLMEFECATNLARMAPFMYSQGDGYGRPQLAKSNILSLLFNPIQDLH